MFTCKLLFIRYRKQNTSNHVCRPLLIPDTYSTVDRLPSNQSDVTRLYSVQSNCEVTTGASVRGADQGADQGADRVVHGDNNPRGEFGKIAVSLLIILHNGFYAFAFEIVVLTTCELALCIHLFRTHSFFLNFFHFHRHSYQLQAR